MKKLIGVVFAAVTWSGVASAGCIGVCGVTTANGDVTNPTGYTSFSYVTTTGGTTGGGTINPAYYGPAGSGQGGVNETNGSTLTTALFSATAGDHLAFNFNFITADGAGYSDYAWAALLDGSGNPAALLFTAQTVPSGNVVPSTGLATPAGGVTLTPGTTNINPGTGTQCDPLGGGCNLPAGGPFFAELGASSGTCFSVGCGLTGWIGSDYTIGVTGTYLLAFGVTNQYDTLYDSALGIAGITIAGQAVDTAGSDTPEPTTFVLLGTALGAFGLARRRKIAA